jgi:hypothetical protein
MILEVLGLVALSPAAATTSGTSSIKPVGHCSRATRTTLRSRWAGPTRTRPFQRPPGWDVVGTNAARGHPVDAVLRQQPPAQSDQHLGTKSETPVRRGQPVTDLDVTGLVRRPGGAALADHHSVHTPDAAPGPGRGTPRPARRSPRPSAPCRRPGSHRNTLSSCSSKVTQNGPTRTALALMFARR